MEENLDQISPILPADFFQFTMDLYPMEKKEKLKKRHRLTDFSDLLFEDSFANFAFGYSNDGLHFEVDVNKPFEECFFPQWEKGDSLELFIDTRDLKTAGFITKFCHHFVIIPQAVEGVMKQEVTRFRTDDKHELCDSDLIRVDTDFHKKRYELAVFIPKECLYGYDPKSFDRLGFSYRINRVGGRPQHFNVSSAYLSIEQHPSLWSRMEMKE